MAPVAAASSTKYGLATKKAKISRRSLLETKRTTYGGQTQSHDVAGDSEPQGNSPFSERGKKSIIKKTTKLAEKRKKLNQQLLQESEKKYQRLPPNKKLSRRELRRITKALMRRERTHMGAVKKLLEKKERLHRQDPHLERAVDFNLVKTKLQKVEHQLGPNMADRERKIGSSEDGDVKTSSLSSETSNERRVGEAPKSLDTGHNPESSTINACSKNNKAAEKETAEEKVVEREVGEKKGDIQEPFQGGLDGAFDDDSRPPPKKRKRGDQQKERRKEEKKVKKEQMNKRNQSSSAQGSEVQSKRTEVAKSAKTFPAGKDAAIDNMSQSKKSKVNGAAQKKKEGWTTIRVNGRPIGIPPPEFDLESDSEEPKYNKIARAMMSHKYNDHVHHKPGRPGLSPSKKYLMSGANMDPEDDITCTGALITPPASDQADHTDGHKSQKRAMPKKRASSAAMEPPRANKSRMNKMKPRSASVSAP